MGNSEFCRLILKGLVTSKGISCNQGLGAKDEFSGAADEIEVDLPHKKEKSNWDFVTPKMELKWEGPPTLINLWRIRCNSALH